MPPAPGKASARPLALMALMAALASLALLLGLPPAARAEGGDPVVVYTAQSATTAQLPLMAAINAGWPGPGRTVEIRFWKSLDELRSLVLAGQGDVWVGHVEALARAAARGAPVALAEITAWRKFFFVSVPLPLDEGQPPRHPASPAELLDYAAKTGSRMGASPPNSPVFALLAALGGEGLVIDSLAPQQLILEMASGRREAGLVPEPMATAAAAKDPSIAVIGGLEAEYARRFGGPDWQPQAAVAVNLAFAAESPELAASLISMMGPMTAALAAGPPEAAADALPPFVAEAVGREVLVKSLARETIMARPAAEVAAEIGRFLRLAAPELYEPGAAAPPDTFILGAGPAAE